MSHFPILQLPTFSDPRGILTVLEGALPFQVLHPTGLELDAEVLLNTGTPVIRIDQADPFIGLR
jgi:hypothetical protein